MPYYLYRIFPMRRLEAAGEEASFAAASARAKALRAAPDRPADCAVKVVFAANPLEAEDLLSQVRSPQPGLAGDE